MNERERERDTFLGLVEKELIKNIDYFSISTRQTVYAIKLEHGSLYWCFQIAPYESILRAV